MKLFHKNDIALQTVDSRTKIQKMLSTSEDELITTSAVAIVKLIEPELSKELDLKIGEKVWFDPRYMVEIKPLKLVIVDKKSILLKA